VLGFHGRWGGIDVYSGVHLFQESLREHELVGFIVNVEHMNYISSDIFGVGRLDDSLRIMDYAVQALSKNNKEYG